MISQPINTSSEAPVLTVSQLTEKIKAILENNFAFIWITGEISNFSTPMSGHFYFTLKDKDAQISAVMFKGQNRQLKFQPKDGMAVTGLGRVTLYPPRGAYQIIFEYLEPRGVGALQVAFEQLKAKLSGEGLFDLEKKKILPFFPERIALITSPTGAVLQDMLKIARRRCGGVRLMVIPVMVQGDGASADIVKALALANEAGADLAILARGGGSLEDMQAFNSESVARAIAASQIPIVSAVGHETDYTIADFVADLRAPTPSAAIELVVPDKAFLEKSLAFLQRSLLNQTLRQLQRLSREFHLISKRLTDPVKKIQELQLRLDDLTERMLRAMNRAILGNKEALAWRVATLNTLNPMAVLDRGYSITRTLSGKRVVTDPAQVKGAGPLEIILAKGSMEVSVLKKGTPSPETLIQHGEL